MSNDVVYEYSFHYLDLFGAWQQKTIQRGKNIDVLSVHLCERGWDFNNWKPGTPVTLDNTSMCASALHLFPDLLPTTDSHEPYQTGSGVYSIGDSGTCNLTWSAYSEHYTVPLPAGHQVDVGKLAQSKKHTFDDAKDWESYYSQPIESAPTYEDFHQLGHPPQCDCGAEKANTTHARWCSKGNL